MMFFLNSVRKNVVFSLIGLGLFSGMSMTLSSGVEAQDIDLLQWRPLVQKAQDETQGTLVLMGKDLVSMADIIAGFLFVHAAFTPSTADIDHAERVIAAVRSSATGGARVDGRSVNRASAKAAARVLELARRRGVYPEC